MSRGKPDPGQGPFPHQADPVALLLGRLAELMDRAFTIPGTNIRFGIDSLLGIIPVGGDVATGLVQTGLVLIAIGRYRVPSDVIAKMMANVLLDVTVGSIPALGDLFDLAFKANVRNMKLLEPYLRPGEVFDVTPGGPPRQVYPGLAPPPTSQVAHWGCLLAVGLVLLGAILLMVIGSVAVIRWMIRG